MRIWIQVLKPASQNDGDPRGSVSPTQPSTPCLHRVSKQPSIHVPTYKVPTQFMSCKKKKVSVLLKQLLVPVLAATFSTSTCKQKLQNWNVTHRAIFPKTLAWTRSKKLINWLIIWLMDSCQVTVFLSLESRSFLVDGKFDWYVTGMPLILFRFRTCRSFINIFSKLTNLNDG